ncbi:MAG: hypothetical protein AB7I42_24090 [Bradyrhizobium sp.]|uniref:hypothetical protein n=1 Tax=Bradyrhizobium sp. TaxID=376 RepID=UPI003D09C5C6
MLTFDPATHAYTFAGKRVASVTQILADVGMIDSRWFTEGAALRGTYVAQAVAWDMRDELDYDTLDEELKPYVDAAREFRAKVNFVPRLIEHPVYCEAWNYAGMLDVAGSFGGSDHNVESLIDWKCGVHAHWHPLQTKAYAIALGRVVVRASVLLRPDGTFRYIEHRQEHDDERLWLACVQVFHAKARQT